MLVFLTVDLRNIMKTISEGCVQYGCKLYISMFTNFMCIHFVNSS